jgi:hypothetical protein
VQIGLREQPHLRDLQRLQADLDQRGALAKARVCDSVLSARLRASALARRTRCLVMPMRAMPVRSLPEQELGDVPAAVLLADAAVDRHAHAVEEDLVDLVPAVDRERSGRTVTPGERMSISSIVMPACGFGRRRCARA